MDPVRQAAALSVLAGGANAPRVAPHNLEAEQALLGAVLVSNACFDACADAVDAEDFHQPVHGRIWAACGALIEAGVTADAITLKARFDDDEALGKIGGAGYLVRLASSAVSLVNARDYAVQVRDLARRRGLIRVAEAAVAQGYDFDDQRAAPALIEGVEAELSALADRAAGEAASFAATIDQAVSLAEAAWRRDGRVAGVATGLGELDAMLGGLQPGDLIVCAGRPGMGKTAMGTTVALNAARAGHGVFYASLEMPAWQIAQRFVSGVSGVALHRMRAGTLDAGAFDAMEDARAELHRLPIALDGTPNLTVPAIRARARRALRRLGTVTPGLIVVDHGGLIRASDEARKWNPVAQLEETSAGLKAMAKTLAVPVLALWQLNRAVEARDDKRPSLADIRGSGSIEQDADAVLFLYREAYYLARHKPKREGAALAEWSADMAAVANRCDVIVAKQRNGPLGEVELGFDARTARFWTRGQASLGEGETRR